MAHMVHTYKVSGLHCDNCIEKIKAAALKIPGVISVDFDKVESEASVEMSSHITTERFNEELSRLGNYSFSEERMIVPSTARRVGDFTPLIVIFSLIAAFVVARRFISGEWLPVEIMHDLMAGFFLIFGFFKIINLKGFADAYSTYDIIAKRFPLYGYIYPFIELTLGYAYFARTNLEAANWITLVLMTTGAIGVFWELRKGNKIQCACLGVVFKIPMTYVTLFEDIAMALMALLSILRIIA